MSDARITSFVNEGLGHTSFLVDLGDGTALVVDPARLPDAQRAEAMRRGLRIAFTADTHTHADYISGSADLVAEVGAEFLAPAAADLQRAYTGLRGGDERVMGAFTLRAVATPGHTPDHLAYLLLEGGDPVALFSGGSLMVGSVGRTDLLGPEQADELARELYRSLQSSVMTLPDTVAVYPTHGAGSFCSAPSGGERTSTIGRERAANPMLAVSDENEFVRRLLGAIGTFPSYFSRLPALNQAGPRHYGQLPGLPALAPEDVESMRAAGAVVIDVRPVEHYADAHIPGSLSIQLRPVFASWLGWLVEPGVPVIFVLDEGQDREDLVRQCLTIGVEDLAGELTGGLEAWVAAGRSTASIAIVGPGELRGTVLDVRQDNEFAAGHVPHAAHVELGALAHAPVPSGPLTTMCGHHERAMTGASILEGRGVGELAVLWDGFGGWTEAGHPVGSDQ